MELSAFPNREQRCGWMMTMLLGIAGVLCCVAMYFAYQSNCTVLRMIDECRADEPSRCFTLLWWIPAWQHHRKRFPKSGLRRQIVREYGLTWLFCGVAFVLMVINTLGGGWPR